jgi:protoporphyrinogen IX oxidase
VAWVSGPYLVWVGHWFSAPWLHGKLLLVLVLSGVHGFFSRWAKDFAADKNTKSQTFYRIINELPTVLMIGIVILVVVKPF